MSVVYHWKHGWIPLDHEAALSKSKGNADVANRMLADAHHPSAGIHSKQDVAKAALALPKLPAHQRLEAHHELRKAAEKHGVTHLLPSHTGSVTRNSGDSEHQFQMNNPKSQDWANSQRSKRESEYAKLSESELSAAISRAKAANATDLLSALEAEQRRRKIRRTN